MSDLKVKRDYGAQTRDGYWKDVPDCIFEGEVLNKKDGACTGIWLGTQVEYDAITVKDDDTLYFVV